VTEHHGLALAAAGAPRGVVCLLSALAFHGIGTQNPSEVWVAVDRRARAPRMAWPPLRVVRFSGRALSEGVQAHRIEGEVVRVYNLAKTIADSFKYRNKLGVDVALEALKDAWSRRRVRMTELDRCARVCRCRRRQADAMASLPSDQGDPWPLHGGGLGQVGVKEARLAGAVVWAGSWTHSRRRAWAT
jgi:predicted transcriptional regulator of viral defense system